MFKGLEVLAISMMLLLVAYLLELAWEKAVLFKVITISMMSLISFLVVGSVIVFKLWG